MLRGTASASRNKEVTQLVAALRSEYGNVKQGHRARVRRNRHLVARGTWKAGRTVAQRSYRHRRPLAPLYVTGVLYASGAVLAAVPRSAGTAPLLYLPLAGLLWWRSRRRKWRPEEKRYGAAVLTAAAVWVQAAAVVGVGPPMPGLLVVFGFAAAVPWWWHHRVRQEHDTAVPGVDQRVAVWVQRIACQGGVLPGAGLTEMGEVPNGWSATIELPPGKLTTENALAAAKRIASAYRMPATSVVVEPPLDAEEASARLLVLAKNPLREVQTFTAPTLDEWTGRFRVGLGADGTPVMWDLWTPNSGACHGLVAGTTGSGKSGFVNNLCTEIRHSGLAVLWLGDTQRGESVPDWQDVADPSFWFAGTVPEIRTMLQAAERVMDGRQRRRSREAWTDELGRERRGRGRFDPTPEEPLLVIVIDEATLALADPECRRIVAMIVKQGRKMGVGITIITQVPSLAEMGGDLTIRSMLASMNIILFRTSDKYSKNMGMPSDLPVNPANLPKRWPDGSTTAGLGYVAAERVSPFRAQYVEDPYHWATVETRVARLEPSAERAAGGIFHTWRERRETDTEADNALSPVAPAPGTRQQVTPTTRGAVLDALSVRGRVHTGVLAKELAAPLSTVSNALRRLADEGLARQSRHGIWEPAA